MSLSYADLYPGFEQVSESYLVREQDMISFASQWDPQPFHTDAEAAKTSVFGQLVACGMHVNSIRGLLHYRLPEKLPMLAGLGAENTRLPNPVYAGDRLTLTERVVSKRLSASNPERAIVRSEHILHNQRGEIVLQLTAVVLVSANHSDEVGNV